MAIEVGRRVWFGTQAKMQWIPAPAIDVPAGKQGYANVVTFLNGGAYARRSKGSAKHYALSWNMKNRADIQAVLDYADGIYGNGYIYYMDPFAMDRNVFPAYWAAPYMNYYDGPVIVDDTRPTLATATTSTNGYPVESAIYAVTSTSNIPSVFLPIPEGHTIHIGAHGVLNSGNATVAVTPMFSSISAGTQTNLTLLTSASTTRTNATWSASSGYIGVVVTLKSTSSGSLQLDGLIAQVLPDGAVVPSGGFISGQGSSGLSFTNQPAVSQYSAALDRVGVSVDLVETEAWQWQ